VDRNEVPGAKPQDVDWDTWAAYIQGRYNMGPAYVGALFSYASGDDYDDPTKMKMTQICKSTSWNPVIIVANDDMSNWHGAQAHYNSSPKGNMIWYQIFGGFKPVPKLDLKAALTYMTVADKHIAKNVESESRKIGTEFDVWATYSIYDQLTYIVGFGYLWTGDNWKDNPMAGAVGEVGNDYLLFNKLNLVW